MYLLKEKVYYFDYNFCSVADYWRGGAAYP